jgi:hypothetical protein
LDYSECAKPTLSVSTIDTGITISNSNINWSASLVANKIDVEEINFTLTEKPNIIKKLVFKLLGISWKVK